MSPLGLLSEDFDPLERRMWGNFPQAYSHVGLIHAAFAASPRWGDVIESGPQASGLRPQASESDCGLRVTPGGPRPRTLRGGVERTD